MESPHPEIFTTVPPQPKEKKPGQLPEHVIKQFFQEGYVVVEDFFKEEELDACRHSIEQQVDALAKNMKKAFRDVWANERLLNAIEQLIGPDIMGHPVWNLRTKTPGSEAATVPWHQDVAYLDKDSYNVLQASAWIPLLDTNETNGCLQMAKRGHKTGRVAKHHCCAGDTWYVTLDEEEMEKTLEIDVKKDLIKLPVKYGGMVLFNNFIPHRSLPNCSNVIRWSLDLRWQTPDKPVGFHGLKDGILFRSSKRPDMKIDWGDSVKKSHQMVTNEALSSEPDKDKEFDTTVHGPWMYLWEITHPNRHTASLKNDRISWHKA